MPLLQENTCENDIHHLYNTQILYTQYYGFKYMTKCQL
jgi:hypothetical protein